MAEIINTPNRQSRREIPLLNPNSHILQSHPAQRQIDARHSRREKAAWSGREPQRLRLHAVEVEACHGNGAAAGGRDEGLAGVESAAEVEVIWVEGADTLGAVGDHGAHGFEGDVADLDEVVLQAGGGDVVAALRLDGGEVDVAEEA